MKRKGFETEQAAQHFASQVGGTIRFAPLPGYMGMEPYWIVEWEEAI